MSNKVRFVVTATYCNIIDEWYFDTVEKARGEVFGASGQKANIRDIKRETEGVNP